MTGTYGKIIVDNRSSSVDRPFTYKIDNEMVGIIKEGMRVVVPFGRGNKLIKGLVIGIEEDLDPDYKVKSIIDVLDDKPIISKNLINLSLWIKDKYLASYIDSFQPSLPPGDFKEVNTYVELIEQNNDFETSIEEDKIIKYLKFNGYCLLDELKRDLKIININHFLRILELNEIIRTTLDIKTTNKKRLEKWIKIKSKDWGFEKILNIIGGRAFKQLEIAEYLYGVEEVALKELMGKFNTSLSVLRSMEKKDVIQIFEKSVYRDPIKKFIPNYKKHELNQMQKEIFNSILKGINNKDNINSYLIHGVTGSGKTEIYLQLVEEMLEKGRDSIVLVPEISLTPQTIDRFVGRFGDQVAVLHSKLSQGERFDQWRSIKEKKFKIVIGARSAIFAPFNNLGLIIIDEEHETTYKSGQNPKYDTIEVAKKRADLENASLIMGTATPSLETYYKAQKGEIKLLEMMDRVSQRELPTVTLVDMRDELNVGNKSIFSMELHEAIEENLKNNKQTILFLNRRGFATFVSCRKCGYVCKCKDCDISMTYHRNINKLRCHYCGKTENTPDVCPECGSNYIKYFGIGTQKVEELTREMFPHANIVRMDGDTTVEKGSYEKILGDMKAEKIDILIGTQMISKGLDFPQVTLVGIIAADTSLNLPDYRSPEKTFQLITQVAGRSGRGQNEGRVILQTYNPDHYSITFSKKQDYKNFYNTEMPLRKEFKYPPFINLINILIYGENNSKVVEISKKVYNIIEASVRKVYKDNFNNNISGPYPAALERIKNNFRWQILLKIRDEELDNFKVLIKEVCISNKYKLELDGVKISIDINPSSLL